MSLEMDLPATADFPVSPMGSSEARRRRLHYERARRRYRHRWPDRNAAIDHASLYLAPVALRPRLPSDEAAP